MNYLIKALLSLFLIGCLTSNSYTQDKMNILKITIEGKKYEQLSLKVTLDKEQSCLVDGLSQNTITGNKK